MHLNYRLVFPAALMGFIALGHGAPGANAGESLGEALSKSKLYIDERYRFEYVDEVGKTNEAEASTLRTRVGITTGSFYGFMITAEFENVANVGDDNFNNTKNGKGTYPIVADVESSEVNQLFLAFNGIPDTKVKFGRQVIVMDNMRFIGHVGWRQNNQTFDAAVVQNTSIPSVTLTYGYIDEVNRIFGNDSVAQDGTWDSTSHFFNIKKKFEGFGSLVGYGYLLDFESDARLASSSTFGGYFAGKQNYQGFGIHYRAEYAHQEDFGANPKSYEADYYHFVFAISNSGLKASVGYEVLGSDNGDYAFQTPLATGHIFNGWADKFLNTPDEGLEDFYIDLTYKLKAEEGPLSFLNGLLLKAQYHDFSSDFGSIDYGTEWGLFAALPLKHGFYVHAKYANYDADERYTDTEKFTVGVGFKRSFSRDDFFREF